jgi:hypothetical protein
VNRGEAWIAKRYFSFTWHLTKPTMAEIDWHRLFGLVLMDLFIDSNCAVELEKELSIKKQYLDIVIIKKTTGEPLDEIPTGLENLAQHNLLTYKSLWEPLDDWAIEKLICHYVNYRKLASPSQRLLPQNQIQLYAISTRYPRKLLNSKMIFKEIQTGVIDLTWGNRLIRLLILSQMPKEKKNTLWLLFSGRKEEFVYGNQHHQWHQLSEKAVLNQLHELYLKKGVVMSYTIDDFHRDLVKKHLHLLPPEEILKELAPEEILKGLPPEERLKGLAPEVIEKYLSKLKKNKTK